MKRLNPLYIIALFATVLFLSFYLLKNEVSSYNEKLNSLQETNQKATQYKEYKQYWKNKAYIERTVNNILKNPRFKNVKVLNVKTQNEYKVKMISDNPKILDNFVNKVLNKKLKIKKLELNKGFVNLEVGFK